MIFIESKLFDRVIKIINHIYKASTPKLFNFYFHHFLKHLIKFELSYWYYHFAPISKPKPFILIINKLDQSKSHLNFKLLN